MSQVQQARETLEDLRQVTSKAELIGGRIKHFMSTGRKPSRTGFRIAKSLDDYATRMKQGEAYADNIGYTIQELPSGRESFSPDASYYLGPFPKNPMRFIIGPPTFAAEVRSEGDYGDAAEEEMADKRADYFAAGTLVVWDVDPVAECVHVYRISEPAKPITYRSGQLAEAEPAVPGWQVAVGWIFG